ncbi:MAG TPA: arginine--tRNA ligase, partial [Candidatus Bathyarchaeia archaeon]
MVSQNPFAEFRQECEVALAYALKKTLPEIKIEALTFSKPPNPEYGQLANSLCFELAKKLNQKPNVLAELLVNALGKYEFSIVEKVTSFGGYVNFHLNYAKFSTITLESIAQLGPEYGFVKTRTPSKIIVEHTSVNPLHPIHIGQARNPMLGDALARILTARGHKVACHYYIDDVGRQSSVVAYGYKALRKPKPDEKSDHFVGKIYTVTSCLVELNRLKKAVAVAGALSNLDEVAKLNKELGEW